MPQTYNFVPGLPNDNGSSAVNRGPWLDQDEEEKLWLAAVSNLGLARERKLFNMAVDVLMSIQFAP
jgi:hypothetical protein